MKSGRHYTGSNAPSSMRTGPGPVAGAGMVMTGGPGKAASKVTSHMSGTKFGVGSSATPKGMKVQKQGE